MNRSGRRSDSCSTGELSAAGAAVSVNSSSYSTLVTVETMGLAGKYEASEKRTSLLIRSICRPASCSEHGFEV